MDKLAEGELTPKFCAMTWPQNFSSTLVEYTRNLVAKLIKAHVLKLIYKNIVSSKKGTSQRWTRDEKFEEKGRFKEANPLHPNEQKKQAKINFGIYGLNYGRGVEDWKWRFSS